MVSRAGSGARVSLVFVDREGPVLPRSAIGVLTMTSSSRELPDRVAPTIGVFCGRCPDDSGETRR